KDRIGWMALGGVVTVVVLLSFAIVVGSLDRKSAQALSGARDEAMPMAMAPAPAAPPPEPMMEAPGRTRALMKRRAPKPAAVAESDADGIADSVDEESVEAGIEGGVVGGVVAGAVGGAAGGTAFGMGVARAEAPAPTRAWFPETFLFEPLVVTSDRGEASVPVKVPDRLTAWRVLALAHSRAGGQGGAVASFASTLPAYVDPVLPPFLTAGDEVRVPVQVVNTTGQPVSRPLEVRPEGDLAAGGGAWTVSVPAQGSVVQYASITARQPGRLAVRASLGGADQVVRALDVLPAGRPVRITRGGTLAAPRELALELPADALPRSERARLLVYPGSLALVRSELAVARRRSGVADDAYALALVARAPALLRALGEEPDAAVLKELKIILSQRAVSHARAPSPDTAALLAEAALGFPDDRGLSALGERLALTLAEQQSPDGTCQGETGWTEQRLLVATAECLRAIRAGAGRPNVKARAALATVRGSGAYERAIPRIDDPYTAAAALASGAVPREAVEPLRAKVRAAIKVREDGSRYVEVPGNVQRSDGVSPPSEAEATAYAVLALQGDGQTPVADLGATLLGSYSPSSGWGDGRANLVALEAVARLFKDKVPDRVSVVLKMDGQVVGEGVLDAARSKEVMAVEAPAPGAAGSHRWTVQATPAVPGLGFSLQLAAAVPWKTDPTTGGLELQLSAPTTVEVGEAVPVSVLASSAAGAPMEIHHALPAGVQVDTGSVQALQGQGTITSFESRDGELVLYTPQGSPGQPFRASYKVIPTLQGTLHAGASSIALRGAERRYVAPVVWTVR
ncbi:MAG TPA: alpha-2-macroglobulin family protein, partial [Myxococcales bacterium]|nr:alpha-2-macroglobulin family protein [Myxococcales bacterium]